MRTILLTFAFWVAFWGMGNAQEKMTAEQISRVYTFIPDTLSVQQYQKQFEEVEKQVAEAMNEMHPDDRRVATLMRYNGLLWGLAKYVQKTNDPGMKSLFNDKMQGFDLDSPDLELLDDTGIRNIVNGYLAYYYPSYSDIERATYLLYNVKSEKVRNLYVNTALTLALKEQGYTKEIDGLIQDIFLCSRSEELKQYALERKAWYYPVRQGAEAPDFEAEDEFGNTIRLSDYRGKIVFIDVWATWCGGCIKGLPYFVDLREKYKERDDIVFLTVTEDWDGMKETWKKFLKDKGYSGRIPHLWPKDREAFENAYCITGIPRYILIDQSGRIVNAWHVGANHEYFSFFFDMELSRIEIEMEN